MISRNLSRLPALAAVFALTSICGRAHATPQLPATAIADDTFLVANVDVAKLDPASLEASAKVVLGNSFAFAQEGLAKYKTKYDAYAASGAESVTFVMSGDPDTKPEPVAYVKLKPGADHAALEAKIREDQKKEAKAEETDFSNDGDFMIMRKKGSKLPEAGSADRAKVFAEILGADAKAFTMAFSPTEKVRAKMKAEMKNNGQQPPWMQSMSPLLADSKWMLVDAKLGDAPTIGMTVQAADETGAKGISDSVTQGGQQLKAQADQMRQAGPQFAGMADALAGISDALKPTQAGSKVSLNIDGKVVGPAVSNLLPFLLMNGGGGGGGPRPAPGGPNPGQ